MSNYKLLCDEKIYKRSDFRKWSLKNHPDKIGMNSQNRFGKISNLVNELLPDNNAVLDCGDSPVQSKTQTPKPKTPKNRPTDSTYEFDEKNINLKKATCFRTTENWSKILNYHRFDKPSFDKKKFKNDMEMMSPKMVRLLQNIRQIDDNDMKNQGKYFKHFIFSDVQNGGYGAKIIASALIANDFNHCLSSNLNIVLPKQNDRKETFGILSSTAIYNKSFTQKHVRSVLDIYNQRPFNVHGDKMRFIVLDSGFKEGIDLYDVKYVHIFENQTTTADLVQAVGRATRSCGQKGLNFVENVGWTLNVYEYSLQDEKSNLVFNDYLKYAGVDLNKIEISNSIERTAIEAAVDYDLNYHINKFNNEFAEEEFDTPYVQLLEGGQSVKCKSTISDKKCGKRSTKRVPFSITQFSKVYKGKLPANWKKLPGYSKRRFFCNELQTNNKFCIAMNEAYSKKNKPTKSNQLVLYDKQPTVNKDNQLVLKDNLDVKIKEQENRLDMLEDMKNLEDMSFDEFRRFINKTFSNYKYKPLKIENLCDKPNIDRIVRFTESQEFVSRYFVPSMFTKGLFVWHSVGTGKTCTAVSLKSFLYEKLDYSVIWVTRKTLKEDVWKNMYDNICDHIIRSKYKNNDQRETLKKYLSKKFIPPMSYKQFSNMLDNKNDLYDRLVRQNGSEDILNKTLIIIDEAHKLYSNSLSPMEQPDMKVIEQKIKDSNSCRVVLMTGTPITKDPMEFIKLLNLIIKKDPFPTELDEFRAKFMDNSNTQMSKKGITLFREKTKGLISYLNRRFDPRQFAQPTFYKINVPLSVSPNNLNTCLDDADKNYTNCVNNISDKGTEMQEQIFMISQQITSITEEIDKLKNDIKADKKNENLKMLLNMKKDILGNLKNDLKLLKKDKTVNDKYVKKETTSCSKEKTQGIRACKKELQNQNYQNSRFEKC